MGIKEFESILAARWLEESSGLVEFKQYVEPWMGFMFWKVDTEFEIKNHLKLHKFPGIGNEREVCMFIKELMNKPFPPKKSPWECHVIENYQNKQLSSKGSQGEMTLLVFRFHHCMADGYSILYALVEKLGGMPISKMSEEVVPQKQNSMRLFNPQNARISFGATNEVKAARQIYSRCVTPITIKMVKEIKNKFGVNFNSVLLAGLSAGLTESVQTLQMKGKKENYRKNSILCLVPLPLPGHPKKLRNHLTGTYMELPISPELDPIQRLNIIEAEFEKAKKSLIPFILPWLIQSVGSLFVNMSASMLKNRVMQAGFSNFVGPTVPISLAGKRALYTDFVTGTQPGVSACSLFLLSFGHEIHITASVESGVFDRSELDAMMRSISKEFEILHELSTKIN